MYVSCHRHFFLVLLLNQRWSPPLTLQASHCSTFRIMSDVPSIAVFCSESIECFPGIVSKFFFKLLVTIPVAPIITVTIEHFRFHIPCISIHKLLYFNFFTASFTQHFCYYYYYYYNMGNIFLSSCCLKCYSTCVYFLVSRNQQDSFQTLWTAVDA